MKRNDGLFMTILALEFSSPQRSVAIVHGRPGQTASVVSEVVETGAGGTRAFGMIQSALREAKRERGQIEVLAIGLGPGSYTGIRIALAIAQGWQLASRNGGMKLLGISSAECLAAQAQTENIRGRVNVIMDAQRNEFYLATYEISAGDWREIAPLKILTRPEVETKAGAKEILIGPEVTRWFPNGRTVYPRAAMLGQLALRRNDFATGNHLEPIYLRETHFVKAPPSRRMAL
jgi:tRNA threonylcarbamoyl adenosine modification protein YeaZ